MSTFIVSFLDNGPKYTNIRTSKEFSNLFDALRLFNSLNSSRKPALERQYTVTEETFTNIVNKSFNLGYNDGCDNSCKKTEDELAFILRFKEPYYWAYCEGYAKGKYNP